MLKLPQLCYCVRFLRRENQFLLDPPRIFRPVSIHGRNPMRSLIAFAFVLLTSTVQAQVYRCGSAYSSTPCAGGRAVDVAPSVSNLGARSGPNTTLYLCQSYGGGKFWTREHCRSRDALVDRIETVPGNLPFEQQVELAKAQLSQGQSAATPAAQQPQNVTAAPTRNVQCAGLDERIRSLDVQARAGGYAYRMDQIAADRKEARDLQFRLRC